MPGDLLNVLKAPPVDIQWLAVIPLSIAIGKWIGDFLDLAVDPLVEGIDWAKLGGVGGGLFGMALYVTIIVAG
jgi:hypothetical protein